MRFAASLLLFALLSSSGCEPEFRQCPTTHTDPTKQLYNDVVIEIVEKQLYAFTYLPDEDRQYINRHFEEVYSNDKQNSEYSHTDSTWLRVQGKLFHNRLFNDSARFRTFYLNRSASGRLWRPLFRPIRFSELRLDDLRTWLKEIVPGREQAALDSLYEPQTLMKAADFELCTFRLQPFPDTIHRIYKGQTKANPLTITLSKAVFNATQDKAIIGFSMAYGNGHNGYAQLLLLEKIQGRWRIKQDQLSWIT
ncbi:hypothetical protein LRS06_00550 [Hymenobacter sp. J193]|uniref:hypothetical protein n=1 Tax=Hymenobacter sp. J193 TaxID=2898429 RepID=UPI002150E857|nr:hypothetical protein [Hymenobacter sp. J193]MCR5886283.1 hypothetical protein [Hymenobacter sp. J193]